MSLPQKGLVVSDPQIVALTYQGKSMGLRTAVIVQLSDGYVAALLPLHDHILPSRGNIVMVQKGEEPNMYFVGN